MTAPISAAQLAMERRTEVAAMVDTCTITSRTRTSDGAGGSTLTEATQTVACRAEPRIANSAETEFGGQLLTGLQWDFVFPYDTTVDTDDEITYQGQRFGVMTVLGPRTNETARRVICVER